MSANTDLSERTVQDSAVRFEVENIRKEFTNVVALDDVNFELRTGEVVGLVGENGAGKSTLLNILSGIYQQDRGHIYVDGERVSITNPREASQHGVAIVHQEHNIIPNLSGYENLFLEQFPDYSTAGVLDSNTLKREGAQILDTLGIDLDLEKRVSNYSFSDRQMLSIAKAFTETVHTDHPIILLDEPTAGLEEDGRDLLFDRIEDLRDQASFVFVSHELDEVLEISDRIYVLRDGKVVNHLQRGDATEDKLQQSMVGREVSDEYYQVSDQRGVEGNESVLTVSNLGNEGHFEDVSFDVHEGEIFGICGVMGSGKSALGRVLSGVDAADTGELTVDGTPVETGSVHRMVNQGVGYVPKERQSEGTLLYQPLRVNVSLPSIGTDLVADKLPGLGTVNWLIDFEKEDEMAEDVIEQLNVKAPSIESPLIQLSGGNQQKVVLGKNLQREVSVLVMDNVTRGIDVGAKEEVYRILRQLADDGVSMVFIADELPELIGMSNRIGVMHEGEMVEIVDAPPDDKPTESEIIKKMI
ncbi:ribose transport system ATP-binding protein [Halopelagius inordinatus]|uniref:Ribose transport system ATP-binding protein n=1 Tax=Halopelagius inordinatus TaxID=553467 RepID=A0A1I2VEK2_9EURY|nr:sugar ABC transporter ATP-binding protein [Halopelagius inordinatus]SFG85856.1 ribose transport system ATP-binding protein [Halopelagius inordinatus]